MSDANESSRFWRKCNICKKPIQLGQKYWVCSVSTCNRVRTDLVFCDVRCFDAHVPVLNHRDAGAFERVAPLVPPQSEASRVQAQAQAQVRVQTQARVPVSVKSGSISTPTDDILIVVSKMKAYIRSQAGMNTSDSVAMILTKKVKSWADRAIESAKEKGRSTVMDQDII